MKSAEPKEQPRHTARLHQLGDPSIYYYLAWASPPIFLTISKFKHPQRLGRASSHWTLL